MINSSLFHIKGSKSLRSLFLLLNIISLFPALPAKAIDNLSELCFETYIDSADYYSSHSRWEDAERMTVKALQMRPANKQNWLLWSNLGEIRLQLNNLVGAVDAFDIGLTIQPNSIKLLLGKASVLLAQKRLEESLSDLNNILQLDSTLEWPRMMRAFILLDKNDYTNAEKDFIYLKDHFPDNYRAYIGLATIRSREKKYEDAINFYRQSIAISPEEDSYFYMILLQAESEKLPEAAESLREALKKFPRSGNLFILQAYLHKLNFQNLEAEVALKLAREYGADSQFIENFFPGNNQSKRKK